MRKGLFIGCIWLLISTEFYAQGCSDAGLCTTGPFKPLADFRNSEQPNKLNIGLTMGVADYHIAVFGLDFGYSRNFGDQWRVDSKITFLSQGGNDIGVSGPGDIFLNLNYRPLQRMTLSVGTKIPLTRADKVNKDIPLPMDYQSSLGTFDLLGGVGYATENWIFMLGVQIPLQDNDNAFFPFLYPSDSPLSAIHATNQFSRSADVLLRISRPVKVNDRMTITPGLLSIYHVDEDEFTDSDSVVKPITGSDGLTLNGTVFFDYALNTGKTLEFSLGFPFIVREARPDGLTRSFVFGIAFSKEF